MDRACPYNRSVDSDTFALCFTEASLVKPDDYKSRLSKLLTKANNLEGNLASYQINWAEWDAQGRHDGPPDWLIDKDDELVAPFEHLAESLFLKTVRAAPNRCVSQSLCKRIS